MKATSKGKRLASTIPRKPIMTGRVIAGGLARGVGCGERQNLVGTGLCIRQLIHFLIITVCVLNETGLE